MVGYGSFLFKTGCSDGRRDTNTCLEPCLKSHGVHMAQQQQPLNQKNMSIAVPKVRIRSLVNKQLVDCSIQLYQSTWLFTPYLWSSSSRLVKFCLTEARFHRDLLTLAKCNRRISDICCWVIHYQPSNESVGEHPKKQ